MFYKLGQDGRVEAEPDVIVWSDWIRTADRVIEKTLLEDKTPGGKLKVLTVFIGIDHQFIEGPPILFETVVAGGARDRVVGRYSTVEEARRGHAEIVESLARPLALAGEEPGSTLRSEPGQADHGELTGSSF